MRMPSPWHPKRVLDGLLELTVATQPELLLLGLSHRTAPLELRETCALAPDELRARLGVVLALEGVREAFLVSTCNRTEILVAADTRPLAFEPAFEGALREVVFRSVPAGVLYGYKGVEAVMHLFRVAAGLDSLILGESQILAQVKGGYAAAREVGGTGRLLEPLLQQALATGKRIRAETSVGAGTLSVARAGVMIARQVFGSFEDVFAVVLGAGETGQLAARHLLDQGLGRLALVNRTPERAQAAAQELGVEWKPIEELPALLLRSDLLMTCVDGAPDWIGPEHFDARAVKKRDRPLVVVDLSVPRAVQPAVGEIRNLISYDLDHLVGIVDKHRTERARAGEEAAPILLAEVHKFLSLRTYAAFSPAVEKLKDSFDTAREAELDICAGDASSPEVVKLAHRLTSHLLDIALRELKDNARGSILPETIDEAYQRFLDREP